jgi:hypothetical protein
LWEKWEKKLKTIDKDLKIPLMYPDLKKRVLLFIGLNPSLSLKGFRKIVKDTSYKTIDPIEFYRWDNRKDLIRELEKRRKIERLATIKYDYFKKFPEIAGEAFAGDTSRWEHIDLFFNHETNQKDFEKKILKNKELKSFVNAQLDLSKKLIGYVEPQAIVVVNALAAEIFEGRLKDEFPLKWNDEYGCHVTVLRQRSIPILLASMLTGQRAMDKGSYRRLKWHIKKAINEI